MPRWTSRKPRMWLASGDLVVFSVGYHKNELESGYKAKISARNNNRLILRS